MLCTFSSDFVRSDQSTPKWTKIDLFRPKWTKMEHFGLANVKIQFGIRSFDQNGYLTILDQFGPAHLPTVARPLLILSADDSGRFLQNLGEVAQIVGWQNVQSMRVRRSDPSSAKRFSLPKYFRISARIWTILRFFCDFPCLPWERSKEKKIRGKGVIAWATKLSGAEASASSLRTHTPRIWGVVVSHPECRFNLRVFTS